MEKIAGLISDFLGSFASSTYTYWFIWDEPECPEELI